MRKRKEKRKKKQRKNEEEKKKKKRKKKGKKTTKNKSPPEFRAEARHPGQKGIRRWNQAEIRYKIRKDRECEPPADRKATRRRRWRRRRRRRKVKSAFDRRVRLEWRNELNRDPRTNGCKNI